MAVWLAHLQQSKGGGTPARSLCRQTERKQPTSFQEYALTAAPSVRRGAPAMMRGLAALRKLMVLYTQTSMVKCTSAATKERRVAPARPAYLTGGAAAGQPRRRHKQAVPGARCWNQGASLPEVGHTIDCSYARVLGANEAQSARRERPGRKRPAIQLIHCAFQGLTQTLT